MRAFHPYLNADAQSKDMIDALAAARKALGKVLANTTTDNGKLFISGYSQGGYVAMATHKAMQAGGQAVTASAPMSGPYALAAFGDAVFFGNVDLGSTIFTPLLATSFQLSYGNIYTSPSDLFEDAFAGSIEGLLPNATPIDQLIAGGELPQLQLFHDSVWNTGSAQLDATLDVPANPLFALGFGPANLVKDTYRFGYIMDALANPDGAVPAQTNLIPAAAPQNTLRQAFKLNDLRSWVPTSPVFMCGGENDPVVFFSVNTQVMQAFWTYVAPPASPLLVTVLDVDSASPGPLIRSCWRRAVLPRRKRRSMRPPAAAQPASRRARRPITRRSRRSAQPRRAAFSANSEGCENEHQHQSHCLHIVGHSSGCDVGHRGAR